MNEQVKNEFEDVPPTLEEQLEHELWAIKKNKEVMFDDKGIVFPKFRHLLPHLKDKYKKAEYLGQAYLKDYVKAYLWFVHENAYFMQPAYNETINKYENEVLKNVKSIDFDAVKNTVNKARSEFIKKISEQYFSKNWAESYLGPKKTENITAA
jgi:hypothetical protein